MLRDITLGQYYRADSVLHRMDPRVKLVATFMFIISLFLVKNFLGYIIAALFLGMGIVLSKVPPKFIFRGMKTIFFLLFIYSHLFISAVIFIISLHLLALSLGSFSFS